MTRADRMLALYEGAWKGDARNGGARRALLAAEV